MAKTSEAKGVAGLIAVSTNVTTPDAGAKPPAPESTEDSPPPYPVKAASAATAPAAKTGDETGMASEPPRALRSGYFDEVQRPRGIDPETRLMVAATVLGGIRMGTHGVSSDEMVKMAVKDTDALIAALGMSKRGENTAVYG